MKCINRVLPVLIIVSILCTTLSACGNSEFGIPYHSGVVSSAYCFSESTEDDERLSTYAASLCVGSDMQIPINSPSLEESYAVGLFDLNKATVLYSKNIYEQLPPASLTKIMTALIALKYGNLDDMITVSDQCVITESGAQLFGFKEGDTLTLDQALHALLMYSANDAALVIAEHISGSTEAFVDLMNKEAAAIGATGSHFVNPHGLTAEGHASSVYDLYLIFNEVLKDTHFSEIIQTPTYSTTYHDKSGKEVSMEFKTTNQYLKGTYEMPENVTVLGGKTGTTNAAGNCLILYAKDSSGNPYISVILRCESRDMIYQHMTELLEYAAK